MKKTLSILFALLLISAFQSVVAQQVNSKADSSSSIEKSKDDYDFENNSFYISDEQLQVVKDAEAIEEKSNFDAKVINSSHFTVGTPSRTYMPLNKNK